MTLTVGEVAELLILRKLKMFKNHYILKIQSSIKEKGLWETCCIYRKEISYRVMKKWGLYLDARRDQRICGIDMIKYIPAVDREGRGTTGTESSPYCFLEKMYDGAVFTSEDVLIDVGCGYGRVLAFLEDTGFPGKLVGVELNPAVSELCQSWITRYDNISLIEGNAFDLHYDDYTVLNMNRPMIFGFFQSFIQKIESELTHPIRLFYSWDGETGNYMKDRPGWRLIKRELVWKVKGIPVSRYPQRYSVWEFTPVQGREDVF